MRLDGARGKMQVLRSYVRTWGLSEADVLHWSSCDIVSTFRRPAVIQCLHSDSVRGELCPLPTVVTPPWFLRAATRLNKSWYTALTRGIREAWALGGAKFSIRPNFCATLRKNEWENFAGRWFWFRNLLKNIGKLFLNFFKSCPNLPPLRTPIALTQKLWQNSSYLQLSGLNNWFYMVITILLNTWICAVQNWWNDGAVYPHLATRQATVSDGCVFLNLLLQLQTRRQLTLATKRQIWHV